MFARRVATTSPGLRRAPLRSVVRDLKTSGLEAVQVLDAIGVVTGSAAPGKIAKLKKVSGVQDVSLDHKVDIGPPGAPVS